MEEVDEIEEAKNWLAALEVNSEFEASSKEYILSHMENQDKIIDEMADIIKDYDIDYSDICKHRIVRSCEKAPTGCKECIKQYFERKVNDFK